MGTYKLQRWWRGSPFKKGQGKWKNITTSTNQKKVMDWYKGYCNQLDGDFRVKSPSGRTIAQKKTELYRQVHS